MEAILINEGFQLGKIYVPPFDLNRGEFMSINFPGIYDFREERQLVEILTGTMTIPGLKLFDRVLTVSSDFNEPVFSRFLKRNTAFRLLVKYVSSKDNAYKTLSTLGIDPNIKVTSLGLHERFLLGLEIAYAQTQNVVINCTALDYIGIAKVKRRVIPSLFSGGTAIEINYISSKGREYLFDSENFPKIKIVDLQILRS